MSGKFIDITLRDGAALSAYVTQPAQGSGPGIVLLHDTAGLDDFVMRTADLYAEEGYVVLAPRLPRTTRSPAAWRRKISARSSIACARCRSRPARSA